MPYPKQLPADEVLKKHFKEGMTNAQIGKMYGTSSESVRQQLNKLGLNRPRRPSHSYYVPWRLRANHTGHLLARRLRAYSKSSQNLPLTDQEERLLAEWREWMDGHNPWGLPMVVHYDANDVEGFWIEPAQPGDRDYIHRPAGLRSVSEN